MLTYSKFHFVTLASLMVLASGCASLQPTQSGFLANYPQMQNSGLHSMSYRKQGFKLTNYDAIVIEPVRVLIDNGEKVTEKLGDYQQLASNFSAYLQSDLSPLFPAKHQAATRPLRLRAVITASDESSTTLNVLSTVLLFLPVDTGGVSVELELQDPSSGQPLYTLSRAVNGSVFQFLTSFSRYGHADDGLKTISRDLAQELSANAASSSLLANYP